MTASRPLTRVPVPPGTVGVVNLLEPLAAALDGSGPAIAPIPTVSSSISQDYVASLLRAIRPDEPRHALESDDVAVVVSTSGSTGHPRGVLLTAANLEPGTTAANGSDPRSVQWVCALPVTSMGGLNVVARAIATGREPVIVPSVGGAGPFTSRDFAASIQSALTRAADVRVSLVPPQLARLLSSDDGIDALRACSLVLVGGAAARPSLLAAASEVGIPITTTYGATETAGGCVFDGRPIEGAQVTIDDGRVRLCGPMIAKGYRGDPSATRQFFRNGCFESQDLGEMHEGRLRILGRIDDVVVINGVNVSPDAVAHVIADLPDIVAASVVTVREADAEPWLAAFLEVRESAPDAEVDARTAVQERLGRHAVPAIITRVDRLPHLPNGKVDRSELVDLARIRRADRDNRREGR